MENKAVVVKEHPTNPPKPAQPTKSIGNQSYPKTKKCQKSQNTKIIIIKKSIKIILMKGSRYPLWGLSFLLS